MVEGISLFKIHIHVLKNSLKNLLESRSGQHPAVWMRCRGCFFSLLPLRPLRVLPHFAA